MDVACLLAGSPVPGGAGTQYVCMAGQVTGNDFTQVSPTNVTLTLTNDATLAWQWQTQYRLTTATYGNGTVTAADGWYASEATTTLTATAVEHWHFSRWEGDTNGCGVAGNVITASMTQARLITAVFEIDPHTLEIVSTHGIADPPVGLYTNAYGSVLTNAVSSPVERGTTQYVCSGWAMVGNEPSNGSTNLVVMTLTNDAALTWTWGTNYRVTASAGAHGAVSPTSAWYAVGSTGTVTATPDRYYRLSTWTGTTNGAGEMLRFPVTRAHRVFALFAPRVTSNDTPHWWLARHGWTTNFEPVAREDQDKDGMATWREYVADTDPTDSNSLLQVTGIVVSNGGARVLWRGGTGVWQYLERTRSLEDGEWSPVWTSPPPTSQSGECEDDAVAPPVFYRIRVERR